MSETMIFVALVVLLYFAISFRYVWKAKHPELGIWRAYGQVFLIVCGTPFLVCLVAYTGSMVLLSSTGNAEMVSAIGATVIKVVATFTLLPAIYVVHKFIKEPPRALKKALAEQTLA